VSEGKKLLISCNHDLEINPMTLKLKGDLDILKMYFRAENEAYGIANFNWKKTRTYVSRVKVKMSKAQNYFERYRNRYSVQAPAVSDR